MDQSKLVQILKGSPHTVKEISEKLKLRVSIVRRELKQLKEDGFLLVKTGAAYSVADLPGTNMNETQCQLHTDENHKIKFGICSDQHLNSKYSRLDVLETIYDIFELEGIQYVINSGNWIDGYIKRINGSDVKYHNLEDQVDYLVENYPARDGMVTLTISGDDHEGWFGKDMGLDVGAYAKNRMIDAGRDDWEDLGFMEAYIPVINSETGKVATIMNTHPGGGSAYAVSYKPQKLVESFTGDEKPDILIIGHYHKLSYNFIRNVHVFQAGCTQDQTPFMRKKQLQAHVGGWIVEALQNPKTGNIVSTTATMLTFGTRGKTNNRWSYESRVNLANRK